MTTLDKSARAIAEVLADEEWDDLSAYAQHHYREAARACRRNTLEGVLPVSETVVRAAERAYDAFADAHDRDPCEEEPLQEAITAAITEILDGRA